MTIFLGGTCGNNTWRATTVIPALLRAGIPEQAIFNPVVEHWDSASAETANVSAYSLVEAIMALYDDSTRTVVVFDTQGMDKHTCKAIEKTQRDLRCRFPDAPIYSTYEMAIHYIADYWSRK